MAQNLKPSLNFDDFLFSTPIKTERATISATFHALDIMDRVAIDIQNGYTMMESLAIHRSDLKKISQEFIELQGTNEQCVRFLHSLAIDAAPNALYVPNLWKIISLAVTTLGTEDLLKALILFFPLLIDSAESLAHASQKGISQCTNP